MIQQIQLVLSPPNDVRIPQSWSYRLYGWLMSQISSEFGEQMHLQGEHPIAHFLCFSPEKQSLIWTVNLLNDAARQVVFPVLESAKEIPLHDFKMQHDFDIIWEKHSIYTEKYLSICEEFI